MEEIRQLDGVELNFVVLDSDDDEEDEEEEEEEDEEEEEEDRLRSIGSFRRLDNAVAGRDGSPTSLHSYLGAVDDTPGRKMVLLDAGAVLSLPMLFLHDVVLFPEATLPLRLIHASLVVAVEKALRHVDAPNTIGVVLMHRRLNHQYVNASVGTTAEIRQLGRLDDGSVNVLTRGQQRFRLIRHWEDVDGVVWGDIQIIEEDTPLRTPRDAFAQLAACSSFRPHTSSPVMSSDVSQIKQQNHMDSKLDCDSPSHTSTVSDHSTMAAKMCHSRSQSSNSMKLCVSGQSVMKTFVDDDDDDIAASWCSSSARATRKKQQHQCTPASYSKQPVQASLSFWPRWVYEMYDSYTLARRAAELWKRTIKNSNMDDHVGKPDLLSFYIGSKLPVSESGRQKLLEIDGIVYRLQREIQLLKIFDIIKCCRCKSKLAKRSDLVEMSCDGPVGTHVNPHGFVHSIITVNNATGLALVGTSSKEYSWFPGYSWTIGECANCGNNIGWFFKTTKKHLCPTYFWGIRTAQIADVVEEDDLEE